MKCKNCCVIYFVIFSCIRKNEDTKVTKLHKPKKYRQYNYQTIIHILLGTAYPSGTLEFTPGF